MKDLFSCNFYGGGIWLLIKRYGFKIENKLKHPPLFSERNGYRKVYRIGKWGIEFIWPL